MILIKCSVNQMLKPGDNLGRALGANTLGGQEKMKSKSVSSIAGSCSHT